MRFLTPKSPRKQWPIAACASLSCLCMSELRKFFFVGDRTLIGLTSRQRLEKARLPWRRRHSPTLLCWRLVSRRKWNACARTLRVAIGATCCAPPKKPATHPRASRSATPTARGLASYFLSCARRVPPLKPCALYSSLLSKPSSACPCLKPSTCTMPLQQGTQMLLCCVRNLSTAPL